jgi:biotin-dependent carboxylase-like uncharacterized protein
VTVIRGGAQTTVQDLGRGGYLGDGIPPSGAFDVESLQLANLLVGNPPGDRYLVGRDPGAAGLEALLGGVAVRAEAETAVAVTGAAADVSVDGEPRAMWERFVLPAGATLRVGAARGGARVYLAFGGGLDVPLILGSRSTNARARLGGVEGRALRAGDRLPLGAPAAAPGDPAGRTVTPEHRPTVEPPWLLGVVLGPQAHLFTEASISRFCTTEWRLSQLADRMGCRFVGPALEFRPRADHLVSQAGSDPSNVVDDVTPLGGIQVPSGLEPIAMGVDFPSIGGYAKIATVISAHLRRLGQARPGDPVRFQALSIGEAVEELRRSVAAITPHMVISEKENAA